MAKTTLGVTYKVQCRRPDGSLRWAETVRNLVVTLGLNTVLDRAFKTVPSDVLWYLGLKGSGVPDPADTMSSHGSWSEIVPYSESTRPQWVPGTIAAGAVDNSGSTADYTINANTNVHGVFMTTDDTKSGTAGTLFSVADFGAARVVEVSDILSVQADLTIVSV